MADTKLKVQIQFQATGDKELARAFKTAAIANEKLAKSVKKNEKLQNKLNKTSLLGVRNNRLLANSFATLRSKLLLASFGFTLISGSVGKFIQKSAEFEKVKVRLNAMFGSVDRGTEAFNTFNKIAATTPFTLQDVVEAGASLKAFGADAESLIKPVSDLAAFMGTSATEAAQALDRAFAGGAGAADILRERGILQLVKDSQGITDLTKITLPEFRAALEKTITDPSVGVAGATDKLSKTLSGLFSNLADSFTRLMAALGDIAAGSKFRASVQFLTNAFGSLADFLKEINKTDIQKIKELKESLGIEDGTLIEFDELSNAMLEVIQLEKKLGDGTLADAREDLAKTEEKLINVLLRKRGIEKANELTFNKSSISAEKLEQSRLEGFRARIIKRIKLFGQLGQAQEQIVQKVLDVPGAKKGFSLFMEDAEKLPELDVRGLLPTTESMAEPFAVFKRVLDENLIKVMQDIDVEAAREEFQRILDLEQAFEATINDAIQMNLDFRSQLFSDHFANILDMAQKNVESRKNSELQALRDTEKFRNASAEERANMEKDALKKFESQQKTIFRLNQLNEIAQVAMGTQQTIAKITLMIAELKTAAKFFKGQGNFAMAALAESQIPGMTKQIGFAKASAAAQAGLIAAQPAPAFARGGSFITGGQQMIMVGDNAGGRERVDITPLSSPDFGDAGGGTGVTVNIMGNVIGTQEFVRDNLLPEIENTIKRNLA
jgi:hypothetical protein